MNKLIIDCGASHCRYALIANQSTIIKDKTIGFSPISQSIENIPRINLEDHLPNEIHFFCTGLTDYFSGQAQKIWQSRYPEAKVNVQSDLVAAALACCGKSKGYVHIIGTGSAVNFWDGHKMLNPKINLGYIWEDFASGYDIGKTIVQLWLENQLSENEDLAFKQHFGGKEDLLSEIYASGNVKAFLAQASPQLKLLQKERQKNIIKERLRMYFTKNIDNFADTNQHHFIGSLAFFMRSEITELLEISGKKAGKILANTMDELCNYYMQ